MAVEYFNISPIQRSAGKSIVAKAAYDSCSVLKDETIQKRFDYNNKNGLVYSQIIFPKNMEVLNRQDLWNKVEREETRKNSCLGRSLVLSLPIELSKKERVKLAIEVAHEISKRYNCPADFNIHAPQKKWKDADGSEEYENPHVHILIPDRDIDGKKIRVLSQGKTKDENGRTETDNLRILLSDIVRRNLDNAGHTYVSYTLEKKPELKERIELHERYTKEIDAEIAATERAIAELERRARSDKRKDTREIRVSDARDDGRGNAEIPLHSKDYSRGRESSLRYNSDASADRPNIEPSGRSNSPGDRHDKRRPETKRDYDKFIREGRASRTNNCPNSTKLNETIALLKHKLLQLQEEKLQEEVQYGQATRNSEKEANRLRSEKEIARSRQEEINLSSSQCTAQGQR